MTDAGKTAESLAKIGVTIHEVLRYGYGGLLAFLVAALISPDSEHFDQKKQGRFYLQHSELHSVHVTFFVLLVGAIFAGLYGTTESLVSGWTLCAVAVIAMVAGFIGDTLLCRQECKVLLPISEAKIANLLEDAQMISPAKAAEKRDAAQERDAARDLRYDAEKTDTPDDPGETETQTPSV